MLNSDASLDLFRKRGAALLQFTSNKVQKARCLYSLFLWPQFHLRSWFMTIYHCEKLWFAVDISIVPYSSMMGFVNEVMMGGAAPDR